MRSSSRLGSEANYGDYNDAKNDTLITATIDTNAPLTDVGELPGQAAAGHLAAQPGLRAHRVQKDLTGVTPQNVFTGIEPENWRWK